MKIKMQLATKIILISILFVLSIVFFILQLNESKNYKTLNTEIKLYNYNCSSDIKYSVKLLENSIFDTQILPQNGFYMPSFVDDMAINFTHQMTGDKKAKIIGKYNIVGTVKGTISDQNQINTLWSKEFIFKPDIAFSNVSSSKQISEDFILDYSYYNSLSKEINEITKIPSSNMIEITMNIDYTIETEHGNIKEVLSPTITIPLSTNYFSVLTTNLDSKTGDIKKTDITTIPPNSMLIVFYRIIIGIIIIIILLLFFMAAKPSDYDIYINRIKKIFKNYGKLLIGINSYEDTEYDKIYYVRSIEDLIKISDEVEKPIFYDNSENVGDINEFYIIDSKISYIYKLNNLKAENLEPIE